MRNNQLENEMMNLVRIGSTAFAGATSKTAIENGQLLGNIRNYRRHRRNRRDCKQKHHRKKINIQFDVVIQCKNGVLHTIIQSSHGHLLLLLANFGTRVLLRALVDGIAGCGERDLLQVSAPLHPKQGVFAAARQQHRQVVRLLKEFKLKKNLKKETNTFD